MKDLLADLNEEQKRAVTAGDGPLLIIAGAGTGKTTVITRRIAWLIQQKKAEPKEILALTFTEKAAAEMEERVDVLVPYGYVDTHISTFHAFGDKILREYPLEVGLTSEFKVLTRPEQIIFLKENLFKFDLKYFLPLSDPTKYLGAIADFISRLKDEDISPSQFEKFAQRKLRGAGDKSARNEAERWQELARFYATYQKLLRENDLIDFGDQIFLVLELFRQHPKILQTYKKQFKYILVDEFQDTNFAQNELLKLLAGKRGNITVVGDDDQAIYRFRGAAISNILDFRKSFSGVKTVVLTRNYRSTEQILDAAYRLIQHNNPDRLESKEKINKRLTTQKQGPEPEFFLARTGLEEAQKIGEKIKELVEGQNYRFKDIAVLVRANNYAQNFFAAFNNQNIPYQFSGGTGLFTQPEIQMILSFLKALTNYADSIAFYNFAVAVFGLSTAELAPVLSYARRTHRGLRTILEYPEKYPDLPPLTAPTQKKIARALKFLKKFEEINYQKNVGQLLYTFLKESKILPNLIKKSETDPRAAIALENIAQFWEHIREFLRVSANPKAEHLLDSLEALIEAGDDPRTAELDPDLDAVNILTVHAAKGLEFKVVFLAALAADRFPARKRAQSLEIPEELIKETLPKGDYHLQEERRLFYVGMTRAKELLFLSTAKLYEGTRRPKKISPFVFEAQGQIQPKLPEEKISVGERLSLFDFAQKKLKTSKRFFKNGRITLSPHHIDDYLTCPKKFEYIHLLEVPLMADHRVSYGTAIHKAIQFYFEKKLKNQAVTLEEVLGAFENAWESEGFLSAEHEKMRFQQGKQTLSHFFHKAEREKLQPKAVEENFKFNLTPEIIIRGRFDIIFKKGRQTTILDFKTSEVTEPEVAQRRIKQSNQMRIYALAWQKLFREIPQTTLYFIESEVAGTHRFSQKELANTEEKIKKVVQGISRLNFNPTPGPYQCKWCAYNSICPYRYR